MTQEEINKTVDEAVDQALPRRRKKLREDDRFLGLRNVLNIIFMIGAIVGVVCYFAAADNTLGTVIIMVSMVFKVIECCFRFIR